MIDSFNGKYRFLSNFAPCKIKYEGILYTSSEHAFQAAKTNNLAQKHIIASCDTPGYAKKRGQKVDMRPDWDDVRLQVMEEILRLKFSQNDFKRALLNTGDEELVEGNSWNDVWWGVCRGKGKNHLGKILMKIRGDLQKQV